MLVEAEVVSNSRNKIHQIWGLFLVHSFTYYFLDLVDLLGAINHMSNYRPGLKSGPLVW